MASRHSDTTAAAGGVSVSLFIRGCTAFTRPKSAAPARGVFRSSLIAAWKFARALLVALSTTEAASAAVAVASSSAVLSDSAGSAATAAARTLARKRSSFFTALRAAARASGV